MTDLAVFGLIIASWWSGGIIATVLLYKRGKIATLGDLAFCCALSICPGPFAFLSLID